VVRKLVSIGTAMGIAIGSFIANADQAFASGGSGTTGPLVVQVQTGQQALYACYIKGFSQLYPNVKVSTTSVTSQQKTGTNLEVLTSSDPPDVGLIPPESSVFAEMSAHHELVPLTAVWKQENLETQYGAGAVAPYEVDGVPYLISTDDTYYNLVYYNVPLFAKLKISIPPDHRLSSVSELLSMTNTLHKAGYQGLAIAGESGYQASWMVDSYLNTSATPAQYQDYLTSWEPSAPVKLSYTAAPFVRALEAIDDMGKAGVFQTGYLGVTDATQSEALFVQGKAGMLLDGEWSVATLQADKIAFPFNWLLLPPVNGSTEKNKISLFIGDDLAIPAKAHDPATAMNFLDFVTSSKGQLCDVENGVLPSINMPASDYAKLPALVQSELADVKQNGVQTGWTSGVIGVVGATFTDPLVQAMLSGQYTPQQVAAKVEANLFAYRAGKV
jgi:raffinose/stachyose/melibiose transport system substrate-binding protein